MSLAIWLEKLHLHKRLGEFLNEVLSRRFSFYRLGKLCLLTQALFS